MKAEFRVKRHRLSDSPRSQKMYRTSTALDSESFGGRHEVNSTQSSSVGLPPAVRVHSFSSIFSCDRAARLLRSRIENNSDILLVRSEPLSTHSLDRYLGLLVESFNETAVGRPAVYLKHDIADGLAVGRLNTLNRFTRRFNILASNLVILPIHRGSHSCLVVLKMQEQKAVVMDADPAILWDCDNIGGSDTRYAVVEGLLRYLADSARTRGTAFDMATWVYFLEQQPPVRDMADTRVAIAQYAAAILFDFNITILQQSDISCIRANIAASVLSGNAIA